jgi:hypothetical protein
LSGPQYDTLLTKTEAMRNSTGAMSEAFGKTTDTLESQIQLLQNRWTVVLERAATAVVPLVSGLLGLITGSLDTRSEMTKLGEQVDAVSRGMAEVKNVDQLADRYAVLTGKAELTKDEQRELTTVTQQLAAAYPGAVTALDAFGKAAAVNVGHVRLLADQQRALFSAQNADLQKKTNKELTDYLSVLDGGNERLAELNQRVQKHKESNDISVSTSVSGMTAVSNRIRASASRVRRSASESQTSSAQTIA